jgi:hypothetical protein
MSVMTAWHTVRIYWLSKAKKAMPSLESQLPTSGGPRPPQSVGQLRATLGILSEQYGIPVRKAKPRVM